jgi:DNA-binding XRE family transcriptional regulator
VRYNALFNGFMQSSLGITYNSAINCTIVCFCDFNYYFYKQKSFIMHYQGLINTIKERRDNLKVNQENLAKLSGVGLRTIKQFESGKGNPTLLTVQKIADVLGLEICLKVKMQVTDVTSENII